VNDLGAVAARTSDGGVPVGLHRGPELVFAIASPIGTPNDAFRAELEGGLHTYGYTVEWVKLSKLLADQAQARGVTVPEMPEHLRVSGLMDEGDRLCEESQSSAAVALHAVNEIRQKRIEYHADKGAVTESLDGKAVPRRAWVIDSLKRPAEVKQLRRIYGDHLIVVGIQASILTRKAQLTELIRPHAASKKDVEVEAIVNALVDRDLDESDKGRNGQSILKTFPMSDVFVDVDEDVGHQLGRLLDLLFGNPKYPVPTDDEYGMHLAFVSSTRSPELGLKVGAAIMRGSTVVSLGANAHPTTDTSSPAFDRSAFDIRQLVLDTLRNLAGAALTEEAAGRLRSDPDVYVNELLAGPLSSGRIKHLTEFQPTVHAEMAAILDAVENGKSVKDATVYVTAYPCHGCAKHLLRLHLPVKYIEPYPKGRAQAMYGQDVAATFQPFSGIAPRRYHQLFTTTEDRKSPEGVRKPWTDTDKKAAEPNVEPLLDQTGIAVREAFATSRIPAAPKPVQKEADQRAAVSAADDDGKIRK
jgi:deoxycytidylate deaminase